jgi:hypothetical protein
VAIRQRIDILLFIMRYVQIESVESVLLMSVWCTCVCHQVIARFSNVSCMGSSEQLTITSNNREIHSMQSSHCVHVDELLKV